MAYIIPGQRKIGDHRRLHPGKGVNPREQLPSEIRLQRNLRIASSRQLKVHGNDVSRIESRIDGSQAQKAFDQQSRTREQNESQASSPVTRKLRKGLRETPVAVLRAFSRKASAISPRDADHAGRSPNSNPVSREMANTNMKTRASIGIASKRCSSAGLNASNNVVPAFAATSPTAPPTSANRVLSVSR